MLARVLLCAALLSAPAAPAWAKDAPSLVEQADDVKIKGDEALIGKQVVCKVTADPMRRGSFTLATPDGTEFLYLKWIYENGHNYYEGYRPSALDTLFFDSEAYVGYKKWLVKTLLKSGVITESGFDDAKLATFAAKTGKEMTRAREEAAQRGY